MEKWSRYNYILDSNRIGKFIYNSRTNSFTKISDALFDVLNDKSRAIPQNIKDKLKELKIFVEENEDDDYFYNKKYFKYAQCFSTKALSLTIATTTECNFRCPYCYEIGTTKCTSNINVNNAIINIIKENEAKFVNITWYGGEPLLNFNAIEYISKIIGNKYNDKTINYSMITNGYLLTKDKIDFLKEYNFSSIQITLDGLQEVNDKTRILANGDGSFNIILKNLEYALTSMPKCKFNIRVNINKDNINDYPKLYEYLKNKFKNNNLYIYHSFIKDYTNSKIQKKCISKIEEFDYNRDYFNKYNIADLKMYPAFEYGQCCANSSNSFVIGPDGLLYKCWIDVGKHKMVVGCILKDTNINPNYNLLSRYMIDSDMYNNNQCKYCVLFPVCDGGCPNRRMSNELDDCCTIFPKDLDKYLEYQYDQLKATIL